MKKVNYENEEIMKLYQNIIKKHRGLVGVIQLLRKDDGEITIKNIMNNTDGVELIIEKDNDICTIDIDYLKAKIYLKTPNNNYKEIYDDFLIRNRDPRGYLYQNNNRIITEKVFYKLNEANVTKHLELKENGGSYVISITPKNELFKKDEFINYLLYYPKEINTIRDLFLIIIKLTDINLVDIKICDSMGSCITINDGLISNYIEYQEKNNQYQKIFLENGEFFVEKKVIGEYRDEITTFIKKLGEYNGKEER